MPERWEYFPLAVRRGKPIRRFSTSPALPHKVIREDTLDEYWHKESWKVGIIQINRMTLSDYNREVVKVSNFSCAYGRVRGEATMLSVVDKVYGRSLEEVKFTEKEKAEIGPHIDEFYARLIRFSGYRYHNGGVILTDLRTSQLVWGYLHGETQNQLYLVDIEPYFMRLPPYDPERFARTRQATMDDYFPTIVSDMREDEMLFGYPMRKGSEALKQFVATIPPGEPNYRRAVQLLGITIDTMLATQTTTFPSI